MALAADGGVSEIWLIGSAVIDGALGCDEEPVQRVEATAGMALGVVPSHTRFGVLYQRLFRHGQSNIHDSTSDARSSSTSCHEGSNTYLSVSRRAAVAGERPTCSR